MPILKVGGLVVLFTLLIGINIYVFFIRGGTSIGALMKSAAIQGKSLSSSSAPPINKPSGPGHEQPNALSTLPRKPMGPDQDVKIVRGTMRRFQNLSKALEVSGVSPLDAGNLISALEGHLDMRALQPAQTFKVVFSQRTQRLTRFSYQVNAAYRVDAHRLPGNRFGVKNVHATVQTEETPISGTIESSLNHAMIKAGGSGGLAARFVKLFAWDINWLIDPRPNDRFKLIVERRRTAADNKALDYGRILAAEYQGAKETYRAFWFAVGMPSPRSPKTTTHKSSPEAGGYFNSEGRSVRRAFLRTPLDYFRISSTFGRRYHPVLHRTKGHYGVDYAAPKGTPIRAAGDGKVARAGKAGGAGNMIVLRHPNGIRTVYMHLSRFRSGMRAGRQIKQGQVIGYVGSTGLATGPHLHYGVYARGRPVDPLTFKVDPGIRLPARERKRFEQVKTMRMRALAAIEI